MAGVAYKIIKYARGEKAGRIVSTTLEYESARNTRERHMRLDPKSDYKIVECSIESLPKKRNPKPQAWVDGRKLL